MAKVLIVDDEQHIRLLLKNIIQAEGHECTQASNVEQAKEALSQISYELVTLDVQMPGTSGLDFLGYMQEQYLDTAVVMITVIEDLDTAKLALERGAFGYISKPFEREEIVIALHSAFRRRELEIVNRSHLVDLETEVRRRSLELARSEERFRLLVEKMNEGLTSIDQERRITYVNRCFCEMLGYREDELLGWPIDRFVDPSRHDFMKKQLTRRREGAQDRYELIWRTKAGSRLHTIISPAALFDEDGRFTGSIGVVTDITELKRTETALKKELAASSALAETAGWLVSSAHLNEISEKILEKTEKLTDSRFGFVGYIDPATGFLVAPTLSSIVWELCQVDGRETVFEDFKGLWGWVLNSRKPILTNDAQGDERSTGTPEGHIPIDRFLGVPAMLGDRLVGMIGLANPGRDYTEEDLRIVQPYADLFAVALDRKRHEEETISREKYLRDILDSIAAGIMVIDQESHVIKEINPTAAKMIGASKEDILGRECWNFVCPSMHNCCPVTDERKSVENSERVLLNIHSEEIPIIKTVAPIIISGHHYLLETFVDITEQKHMEFKLAQAQKLEAIGQLAAGIAHEINTPMQFIQGNIEFLEEALTSLGRIIDDLSLATKNIAADMPATDIIDILTEHLDNVDLEFYKDEIPQAVAGSLEGVERIGRIVASMRFFAHPGKMGKSLIDLNETVNNALIISRNQWKYYAEVTKDLDPDLPKVSAYAPEVNQVLLNLIINAAHAVAEAHGDKQPPEGLIHIATRLIDSQVELRIQDNGTGIPVEYKRKIFEPFFTTKEVGKGTGQGLAISYSIVVEKHGGEIDFETELGQGTTFIVRLPIHQEPAG